MSEQIVDMTKEEREKLLKETFEQMLSRGISLSAPLQSRIAEYLATGKWQEVGRGFYPTWWETYFNGFWEAITTGIPVEIPADQYQDFLDVMGWNPFAKQCTTKSRFTYKQAKNIAKAGNIDSLIYDIKSNAVLSTAIAGITFVISYSYYRWNGEEANIATSQALSDALSAGGGALLISVLSSQALKTKTVDEGVRLGVRAVYSTEAGRSAIRKVASAALGKAGRELSGRMAVNYVTKVLKSNVVTQCVTTAVITAPDFYRATISKNISWAQFGKNLTVNVAGVAGGAGGWMAGAAAGAAAGTVVPGIGNAIGGIIGGIIGAIGGSVAASAGTKAGLDKFVKDDSEEMLGLLQEAFEQVCQEYLLSQDETDRVIELMKKQINEKWFREMYGSGETHKARKSWAYAKLDMLVFEIVKQRPAITLPAPELINSAMEEIAEGILKDQDSGENATKE